MLANSLDVANTIPKKKSPLLKEWDDATQNVKSLFPLDAFETTTLTFPVKEVTPPPPPNA